MKPGPISDLTSFLGGVESGFLPASPDGVLFLMLIGALIVLFVYTIRQAACKRLPQSRDQAIGCSLHVFLITS